MTTTTPMLRALCWLSLCGAFLLPRMACGDVVELTNGSKIEGQITARDDASITVRAQAGERTITRRLTLDKIQAITVDGRREVLGQPSAEPRPEANAGSRGEAEVEAIIDKLGRTPPEWWSTTALDYPRTLDLNWSDPPFRQWDNQRYVGQYVWDIINPNPTKWRDGVRFMHHLMGLHKDNPSLRQRAMNEIGRMYFDFFHDYARAAFFWRMAGVADDPASDRGVALAECYWQLGCKPMAMALLDKLQPQFSMIKLWAQMDELPRALALADANASGEAADVAFIYAGDACRVAGKHQQALKYYHNVLQQSTNGRFARRVIRNQQRAEASIEAIRLFDTLDLKRIPDGTYRGNSLGYQAPVWIEATVRGGRIESVRVIQHEEKQYFTAMTDTPRKIIDKQSVQGIDATSGATITSQAIIHATAKALAGGMK